MEDLTRSEQWAAVASVGDPTRRALLDLVFRSAEPVGRDEAAVALGVPRGTAAFHLDRLVDLGLLETHFQRRSGRTGPGAGRPAKLYRRRITEVSVSLPERRYDLAAELLATAIEESARSGESVPACLDRVSSDAGRALGASGGTLDAVLVSAGYEPVDDGEGGQLLTNCPFHRLAQGHAETICGANLALLEGVVEGTGEQGLSVRFEPRDGLCCVHLVTNSPDGWAVDSSS